MKFTQNQAHFVYGNWSVSIYRSLLGNKMDGKRYVYSFDATQCEPQGDGFIVTNRVKGNGGKREAIKAIRQF